MPSFCVCFVWRLAKMRVLSTTRLYRLYSGSLGSSRRGVSPRPCCALARLVSTIGLGPRVHFNRPSCRLLSYRYSVPALGLVLVVTKFQGRVDLDPSLQLIGLPEKEINYTVISHPPQPFWPRHSSFKHCGCIHFWLNNHGGHSARRIRNIF